MSYNKKSDNENIDLSILIIMTVILLLSFISLCFADIKQTVVCNNSQCYSYNYAFLYTNKSKAFLLDDDIKSSLFVCEHNGTRGLGHGYTISSTQKNINLNNCRYLTYMKAHEHMVYLIHNNGEYLKLKHINWQNLATTILSLLVFLAFIYPYIFENDRKLMSIGKIFVLLWFIRILYIVII